MANCQQHTCVGSTQEKLSGKCLEEVGLLKENEKQQNMIQLGLLMWKATPGAFYIYEPLSFTIKRWFTSGTAVSSTAMNLHSCPNATTGNQPHSYWLPRIYTYKLWAVSSAGSLRTYRQWYVRRKVNAHIRHTRIFHSKPRHSPTPMVDCERSCSLFILQGRQWKGTTTRDKGIQGDVLWNLAT